MPRFRCEHCRQKIAAPDAHAGKRVRCPRCKQAIRVPEEVPAAVDVPNLSPDVAAASTSRDQPPADANPPAAAPPIPPASPFAGSDSAQIFAHRDQADHSALFGEDDHAGQKSDVSPEEVTQAVWHTHSVAEYHDAHERPGDGLSGFVSQPIEPPPVAPPPASDFERESAFDTRYPADDAVAPTPVDPVVVEAAEVIDVPIRRQGPPLTSVDEVADLLRRLDRPAERARLAAEHVAREKERMPPLASSAVAILGCAAGAIGIAAIACCFVPRFGTFAIPIGALGMILAVAGLVAAVGKRAKFIAPMSGALFSAGGIVLAVVVSRGLIVTAQDRRVPQPGSAPPVRLDANVRAANLGTESPAAASAPIEYVSAASPLIAGHVEVKIVAAAVLRPAVYSGDLSSIKTSDERRLQITLELKTLDAGPVTYDPWRRSAQAEGEEAKLEEAKLTDASGTILPLDEHPYAGPAHPVTLAAGALRHPVPLDAAPKQDVLLFDEPIEASGDLRLDLPGRNIGAPDTILHILIPAAMVRVQS